jgi:hypothetical protein
MKNSNVLLKLFFYATSILGFNTNTLALDENYSTLAPVSSVYNSKKPSAWKEHITLNDYTVKN